MDVQIPFLSVDQQLHFFHFTTVLTFMNSWMCRQQWGSNIEYNW